MICDDDFFMQNADYHYGATDAEKMYGRNYDGSSSYYPGYIPGSTSGYESSAKENSGNDNGGKLCIIGILIVLGIILIPTVLIPAITDSMTDSVTVYDLEITRYSHSSQYHSEIVTDEGYEITYNEQSYGTHAINVIFYSKNGKVLYNDSNYVGICYLGDVPYQVHLDEKADYAIFEVYRTHLDYGKCIYRERVDVDNVNVKKEFIDYDAMP